MRQLTYGTYAPVPATWCYKPREELLGAAPMGPKVDVYSWASVVYEVGAAVQCCQITCDLLLDAGVLG